MLAVKSVFIALSNIYDGVFAALINRCLAVYFRKTKRSITDFRLGSKYVSDSLFYDFHAVLLDFQDMCRLECQR